MSIIVPTVAKDGRVHVEFLPKLFPEDRFVGIVCDSFPFLNFGLGGIDFGTGEIVNSRPTLGAEIRRGTDLRPAVRTGHHINRGPVISAPVGKPEGLVDFRIPFFGGRIVIDIEHPLVGPPRNVLDFLRGQSVAIGHASQGRSAKVVGFGGFVDSSTLGTQLEDIPEPVIPKGTLLGVGSVIASKDGPEWGILPRVGMVVPDPRSEFRAAIEDWNRFGFNTLVPIFDILIGDEMRFITPKIDITDAKPEEEGNPGADIRQQTNDGPVAGVIGGGFHRFDFVGGEHFVFGGSPLDVSCGQFDSVAKREVRIVGFGIHPIEKHTQPALVIEHATALFIKAIAPGVGRGSECIEEVANVGQLHLGQGNGGPFARTSEGTHVRPARRAGPVFDFSSVGHKFSNRIAIAIWNLSFVEEFPLPVKLSIHTAGVVDVDHTAGGNAHMLGFVFGTCARCSAAKPEHHDSPAVDGLPGTPTAPGSGEVGA